LCSRKEAESFIGRKSCHGRWESTKSVRAKFFKLRIWYPMQCSIPSPSKQKLMDRSYTNNLQQGKWWSSKTQTWQFQSLIWWVFEAANECAS
jgi:hypothetical protein